MSQESVLEPEGPEDQDEYLPPSASLSGRMAARSAELEAQQTAWFPVPGYDAIVEVELRSLPYTTIRAVQQRNERVREPGKNELYTLADQIAKATVGFREVGGSEVGDDWIGIARRASTPERPVPDQLTIRQAILFVVTDKRIHFLVQEWGEWSRAVRSDIDEEVVRDFSMTE